MAEYTAKVSWRRDGAVFLDNRYSRRHRWSFDGGLEVPASSSPHVVRVPLSDASAVDPEEAYVAALSSCHMLFFLSMAAERGFLVDAYDDDAVGVMSRDGAGKMAMTRVTLRPQVAFAGDRRPSQAEFEALHHDAHEACFIASSVKSEVGCEPTIVGTD